MTAAAAHAVLCVLLCGVSVAAIAAGPAWPRTRAERTDYAETSHYDDVMAYLHDLQRAGAPMLLQEIGVSTKGHAMPLAILARPMVHDAAEARRQGKPVIYLEANIHAGEVEGKEAALALMRDLSADPRGLLDHIVLVIDPIYNIDGNEMFGPQAVNRPEQNGPELVGHRENGQGFDLNRDCIKAESPEMRAVLEHVYGAWDPDAVIDLHTTDGTRHGFSLTYAPSLAPDTDPGVMRFTRDELLPAVRAEMRRRYHEELFDYGNAERRDGKLEWHTFGFEGRYVTNYAGLRNRIAVLSEATTYLPFRTRVESTYRFVHSVLDYIARRADRVLAMNRDADAATARRAATGGQLGVRFQQALRGDEAVLLERPPAEGTPRPTGAPTSIESIVMPVYDRFEPTRTAKVPRAWLLPPDCTAAVALLRRHGIVVERLLEPLACHARTFAVAELHRDEQAFQGHHLARLEGAFGAEELTAQPGWFVVRADQPLGTLAFTMLEPESTDGLAAWGFLDTLLKRGAAYPVRDIDVPVAAATVCVG